MGYFFLSISLFAGAAKGFCGKKTGDFAENMQSAALLNLIRMLICVVLGMLMVVVYQDLDALTLHPTVLLISALSGVSTAVFVVTWLVSVRKSAYMMLDVFLMLGTLVPMTLGYFCFSETVSLNQVIGFLIIVTAVVIMCSYNNSVRVKLTLSSFAMLALCGFVNGITDFSQKMFVKLMPSTPLSIFNLYTYIFAAISLMIIYALLSVKEKPQFSEGSAKKYIYILIMSVALIANSYFKTKAAQYLDSANLYPLNQAVALTLSTLMSSVFFKEKLTAKCMIGILLAFVGLLFMNVL